ncbi:MAG: TolC family protein [Opitutales bacterium]|nr:TolC family protein [Opitutales bacterium]
MPSWRVPALAASLLALAAAPSLHAAETWTLSAAMAEARANSPDAEIARERIEAARGTLREAASSRMPHVHVESGYSQTDQPMMAFGTILNTGVFDQNIDFNRPGQVDHFRAAATVAYNLYAGGTPTAHREAARAGERAARADHDAMLESLGLAVIRGFYGILQARETAAALDSGVEVLRESRRVARERFDRGQMLRNELLNIEVQLADTEVRLLAAENAALFAERAFLVLLGREPRGRVQLAEDAGWTAGPPEAEERAVDRRAELAAMRARIDAADAQVDAMRGGRRPTVDLFATYQYDRGWRLRGDGDSWVAGLRVQMPLFDGGRTSGQIQRSLAERSEARAAKRKLTLQLQLQLEETRLAHELARNQLEMTARLVEQAEESATISRARFEAGDLLATELIGAETRLTEARVRRALAEANERVAAAALRRAAGLPLH